MNERYFNPGVFGSGNGLGCGFGRGRGWGRGRGPGRGLGPKSCPYGGTQCPFCPFTKAQPLSINQTGSGTIKDTIISFFLENPNPSDKQIHNLAKNIGINKHEFEEIVYAMLSDFIKHKHAIEK